MFFATGWSVDFVVYLRINLDWGDLWRIYSCFYYLVSGMLFSPAHLFIYIFEHLFE